MAENKIYKVSSNLSSMSTYLLFVNTQMMLLIMFKFFEICIFQGRLVLAAESEFERDRWLETLEQSRRVCVSFTLNVWFHLCCFSFICNG